jgi:quaternary ammonium compound-resistance protein SugE
MNAWLALTLAGLLEVGFTTCMKLSDNFTHVKYIIGFLICTLFSFIFLNKAISQIPLGTAYAIWTGIGAFGTVVIGMVFFKDPVSILRILLLMLLVGSILGLKLIADE